MAQLISEFGNLVQGKRIQGNRQGRRPRVRPLARVLPNSNDANIPAARTSLGAQHINYGQLDQVTTVLTVM